MLKVLETAQKSPRARDITEAIGRVPIVRLNRLNELCQHQWFGHFFQCWMTYPLGFRVASDN